MVAKECSSGLLLMVIPAQNRLTHQIVQHWQPFRDRKLTFAVSCRAEQLRLRTQQRIIATAEDSVLRTEMVNRESQEEDTHRRVLWFKPMSWLGQIRTQRRDEVWSASLWQSFFCHVRWSAGSPSGGDATRMRSAIAKEVSDLISLTKHFFVKCGSIKKRSSI